MKQFLILIVAVTSMVFVGCSDSPQSDLAAEMGARKIGEQGKSLYAGGDINEAAKRFKELTDKYSHTKYYMALSKEMQSKGISIESPLESISSISMFKLQNSLVTYKKAHGNYPNSHAIKIPKDAWGHTLHYEIFDETKSYEFLIFSKGIDGRLKTKDDLVVVYAGNRSEAAKYGDIATDEGSAEGELVLGDNVSLDKIKAIAEKDPSLSGSSAAKREAVALQDIEAKDGKTTDGSDGEVVKSLDELLAE